jgi:hypothetical protein
MDVDHSVINPPSEFDDFLFAVICEESGGAGLSVLSALARIDVDPWNEAARIAALDVAGARDAVAVIIDRAMKRGTPVQKATTVERLVRLLPGQYAATRPTPYVAVSRAAKAPDFGMQVLIFLVGWWSFVMVVAAFAPQKATTGAEAPAPYRNSVLLPRDYQPEGSPAIRDGFPYAINRSQH